MTQHSRAIHAPTSKIIEALRLQSKKVDAHGPEDGYDEDVVYLDTPAEDALTDGTVICVKGFESTGDYAVSVEGAHHHGGWPTYWSSKIGTEEEVVAELIACGHPVIRKLLPRSAR